MIESKLNDLAELRAKKLYLERERQIAVESLMSDELRLKIYKAQKEFDDQLSDVGKSIEEVERVIKNEVLNRGETVKGEKLMAVWAKGRTSWNTKALDGYAASRPEILQFKTVGEPSVSIRMITEK